MNHAIIGCGRVAPNHATAVADSGVGRVVWACDRDPVALEAFAARYSIPRLSLDHSTVLNDPAVDSVSIAVDHAQHAPLARAALQAGKHVLVEKPTALSVAEGRELIELAARRRLLFATVAQHRFDPLFQEVKRLVTGGKLGPLVSLWATLVCGREPGYYRDSYWRGTWAGEGGSLFVNQAYHCIDLLIALGGQPAVISCKTEILKLGDVLETEDAAVATLVFPNGALGLLACVSATTEFWRSRFDIIGAEGSITFDIDHPAKLHHCVLPKGVDTSALETAAALIEPRPPGLEYYGVSHNRQLADFLGAVREARPHALAPEAGLDTLKVISELYAAARRSVDCLSRSGLT